MGYMTVGIGALLLGVNVWFLLCLVFCRSRISCCSENNFPNNTMGKKDTSVDTEIIGLSTDSIQHLREQMSVQQQPQQPRRSQSQSSIPPLRTETLRSYHHQQAPSISDNNSERSTSTTSQSQCGHSESGKKYHNSRQNTISYISNTGATIT